MIDSNKIVDNMKPWEFRFKRYLDYQEISLPVTKYGEQYYLLKREEKDKIIYYVTSEDGEVVGRFYVGGYLRDRGLTYRIASEYQNRGIGQLVLGSVVDDAFNLDIDSLKLHPTNERSEAIAIKNGFSPMHMRVEYYKLTKIDYLKNKEKSNLFSK